MVGIPVVLVFVAVPGSHTYVDLLVDAWNAFVVVTVGHAVVLVVLVIVVDHLNVFADFDLPVDLDEILLVVSETENLDEYPYTLDVVVTEGLLTDALVESSMTDTCVRGSLMEDLEGCTLKDRLVWELLGVLVVLMGNHVKDDTTD